MKLAQYKLSRRMKFRGLDVSIETDEGEIRHWTDKESGTEGKTKFRVPYGYIRRTEGMDGDHVDVFIGPYENADNVYVIHQMKLPDFKKFDEDKCMLGFGTAEEAKAMYLNHFNDDRFFGSMTTMPFSEFKTKVLATFETPKKLAGALQYRQETPMSLSQALHQFAKTGAPTVQDSAQEATDITRKLRGFARRNPITLGSESASNLAAKTASAPYVLGAQQAASCFRPKTAKDWASEVKSNTCDAIRRAGKEMAHDQAGQVGIESSMAVKKLRNTIREKKAAGELSPEMSGGGGPSLGDPNFWGGGSQQAAQSAQPQDAEEAIGLLPGGTFQGANIKIAPDGQKSTSVKVSPDALSDPNSLAQFFQLPEPGTKIEISLPDQVPTVPVQGGGGGGMGAGPVPGGAAPADPGMMG
jgi:hypothetical protein